MPTPTLHTLAADLRTLSERVQRLEQDMQLNQNTLKDIYNRLHSIETSIATVRTFFLVLGGVIGPLSTFTAIIIQHYWH